MWQMWQCVHHCVVLCPDCVPALSLEPYSLSLPVSMSSCSLTDRLSPTLLSMSSGLSGDSADLSHKGGYVQPRWFSSGVVCFISLHLNDAGLPFLFQHNHSEDG